MKKMNVILALIVALSAGSAFAGTKISILANGNMMQTTASGSGLSISTTGNLAYGGGVLFAIPTGPRSDFEIGGFYGTRSISILTNTNKLPFVSIPVAASFWVAPVFGFDLGGYFALGAGNVTDQNGNSMDYASAGYSKTDYGLRGGVKFVLPMGGAGFMVGAHYNYGLAEVNSVPSAGVTTKWNGFDFVAGLTFGLK